METVAYPPRVGGGEYVVKVPGLARIRTWRLMTQAELSEKSGVGTNTLSRLENGSEATVRTVRRLARALQVSPYELTEMNPDHPPAIGSAGIPRLDIRLDSRAPGNPADDEHQGQLEPPTSPSGPIVDPSNRPE
jgi:transcriptional regulator with XRE-family HTH domain